MTKIPGTIAEKIEEIVSSRIEEMTFIEVSKIAYTPALGDEKIIAASLQVYEPFQDEFGLAIERDLAFNIASSLFSAQEKIIDEELVKDLTLEILNMLAGAVMATLLRNDMSFKLGIPIISSRFPSETVGDSHHFNIEGNSLFFNTPSAQLFEELI